MYYYKCTRIYIYILYNAHIPTLFAFKQQGEGKAREGPNSYASVKSWSLGEGLIGLHRRFLVEPFNKLECRMKEYSRAPSSRGVVPKRERRFLTPKGTWVSLLWAEISSNRWVSAPRVSVRAPKEGCFWATRFHRTSQRSDTARRNTGPWWSMTICSSPCQESCHCSQEMHRRFRIDMTAFLF